MPGARPGATAVTSDAQGSESRRSDRKRVIIHVGAPKTGTTFIQGVLWRNRDDLRSAGLHIVGQSRGDHYRAGHDIRGVEYNAKDPRPDWAGSWDLLAGLATSSGSRTTIISDEHLAALDARAGHTRGRVAAGPRSTRGVHDAEPRPVVAVGASGVRQAPVAAHVRRVGDQESSTIVSEAPASGSGTFTTRST